MGRTPTARRRIAQAGVEAVTEAVDCYRRGDRIPPGDRAAWLTVMLQSMRVRDDAWCRMTPEYQTDHLRLWTDLTRLAQPGYVSAPVSLLAFVAWQCGMGALANIALDRALDDCPGYPMATALRQVIDSGLRWSRVRHLVPPELAIGQARPA